MRRTLGVISHYESKLQSSGLNTADGVLGLISKEIERDGLYGSKEVNDDDAPYVIFRCY